MRAAVACTARSLAWQTTRMRGCRSPSSGSRGACCCGLRSGEDEALVRRRVSISELERIAGAKPVIVAAD